MPLGLPPQYFTAISASKARRFGPLIWDAARRRSAICDGLSDGRHSSVESCIYMIGPFERNRGNLPEGSSEHAYSSIVISFPEIALALRIWYKTALPLLELLFDKSLYVS